MTIVDQGFHQVVIHRVNKFYHLRLIAHPLPLGTLPSPLPIPHAQSDAHHFMQLNNWLHANGGTGIHAKGGTRKLGCATFHMGPISDPIWSAKIYGVFILPLSSQIRKAVSL